MSHKGQQLRLWITGKVSFDREYSSKEYWVKSPISKLPSSFVSLMSSVNPKFDHKKVAVILLGAGEWPHYGPEFNNNPAPPSLLNPFYSSFKGMRNYFLQVLEVKNENILPLFNLDDDPLKTLNKMKDFLEERICKESIEDVFFYYVGHGRFDEEQKYCFLIRSSDQYFIGDSAFRISQLSNFLKKFSQLRRYIILDTCFSGEARNYLGTIEDVIKAQTFKNIPKYGTLLFCSSSSDKVSTTTKEEYITLFEEYITLFTGSVLKVLKQGNERLPKFLSFREVAELTREWIKQYCPKEALPELHIPGQEDGDIGNIPIFPNLNYKQSTLPEITEPEKINVQNELIDRYFKQVHEEHKYLRMIDLKRELKLEDIYVSLTIAPESVTGRRLSLNATGNLSPAMTQNITKVDVRRDLGSPQRHYLEREVTLQELISQRKVIILGEPGSGKTTLLRHLITRLCKREILVDKIPVFIKLSDLRKEPGCVQQYLKVSYEYVCSYLIESTAKGNVVFFIDGLDEVPKEEHELVEREINRLAANQNQIFLTCRIAAFPKGLFSGDYKTYECIGFNPAQQKRFLKGWFSDRLAIASEVERQIRLNKGTFGFSRNPLLLSLMAIVTENDPKFTLPSKRLDLYSRAIEHLMNRRNAVKGIKRFSKRFKIDILKKLSYELFVHGREIFEDEELLRVIDDCRHNNQQLFSEEEKTISSESIMEILIEQDGLLARQAKSSCRFLHLTFQEYFTAKFIAESNDWEKILYKRVLEPRWEEVIRLLAGILPTSNSQKMLEIIWNDRGQEGSLFSKWLSLKNRKDLWSLDRLFLSGRCVSDMEHVEPSYLNKLLSRLLYHVFESNLDTQADDATLSLALVCSSHEECLERVVNWFQQASSQLTTTLLFRYIQVLKLTISRTSLDELLKLFRYFVGMIDRLDEVIIQVIGLLEEAIGNFGYADTPDQIGILLSQNNSYLCATTAQALSNISAEDVESVLWKHLSSPKSLGYLPSAYALLRYQDPKVNKELILKAFDGQDNYSLQLLVRQVIDIAFLEEIDKEFILELLAKNKSDLGKANLLSSFSLFITIGDDALIRNIIFDQNYAFVLRCSAIEAFVHLYPRRLNELFEKLFTESVPVDLLRLAVSSLSSVGSISVSVYPLLCKKIDISTDQRIIISFLRLIVLFPSDQVDNWLIGLIESSISVDVRLHAIMALATTGSKRTLPYLKQLILSSEQHIHTRILVYKALSTLNCEESMDILISQLTFERNILAVTHIIESLGGFRHPKAEQALLMCLVPEKWPKNWPPPQLPIEKGEQKPSDRRRLSAIIGLNRILSNNSLPFLKRIAEDNEESQEIRETAYLATRNITYYRQ
ncbi:MAG: hypothetical protein BWK78_01535 [Thiotrichaceae bacterium IS1]|nr:MAG: hypothetical protein BWK78_01535 [Thiotrichaceae bacterium IS1]